MKRILKTTMIAVCAGLFMSGTIHAQTTDQQQGQKTERHVKMVKIENGKKTEIDTVLTGNQPFIWNGDTVKGGNDLKWISKDDFKMDSLHQNYDMNFEYEMNDDGEGNVFIMKSGKGDERIMMPHKGTNMPFGPKVMMIRSPKSRNVIDLSDPGIISYDKKLKKDGTEKITIVRKQVPENEINEEEIIMHAPHSADARFYGNAPKQVKTIKVIKDEDGNTQVIEDGKVIRIQENTGDAKFIGDDGKVIIIKEKKEGGEKKIEVIVEEEKEKK